MQAGVVIFGKQVDNDVLYHGIINRHSHAYSSLYLSNFLSFHILNNEFLYPCFEKMGSILVYILSVVSFIHLEYPSVPPPCPICPPTPHLPMPMTVIDLLHFRL